MFKLPFFRRAVSDFSIDWPRDRCEFGPPQWLQRLGTGTESDVAGELEKLHRDIDSHGDEILREVAGMAKRRRREQDLVLDAVAKKTGGAKDPLPDRIWKRLPRYKKRMRRFLGGMRR